MSEFTRPIPKPKPESLPFWKGCREEQFLLQYCDACGRINWFPRDYCVGCGGHRFTWKPAAGEGILETYTIVYRAMNPAWESEVPYMLGMVKLKEGIRMVTRITSHKGEDTPMGAKVRVKFVPAGKDIKLPFFEVVDAR